MSKAATPALSPKFTDLCVTLQDADRAFSDAIDQQGIHMKNAGTDKKLQKRLDALENKTSDAADRAWRDFCRYRPQSPEELARYLTTILHHERAETHRHDIQETDLPHIATILKNANAALVDLLFTGEGRQ